MEKPYLFCKKATFLLHVLSLLAAPDDLIIAF